MSKRPAGMAAVTSWRLEQLLVAVTGCVVKFVVFRGT